MFIQMQETPNPNSVKFLPGRPVLGPDVPCMDFTSLKSAQNSALAKYVQVEVTHTYWGYI